MQRDSFSTLFFKAFGYAVLGNVMCLIMTVSLAPIASKIILSVLSTILAIIIYFMMTFAAGYKDGEKERKLLATKRIDGYIKYKWLKIGALVGVVMCIPSIILLLSITVFTNFNFLGFFRILSGAAYPFSLILAPVPGGKPFIIAPIFFMFFYMLTAVSCELGFYVASNEKITIEKIIYKQKK